MCGSVVKACLGNSLAVQWLGLHTLTAEGRGSIPGVQSLVWELKSHKPCGAAKKEKEREGMSQSWLEDLEVESWLIVGCMEWWEVP